MSRDSVRIIFTERDDSLARRRIIERLLRLLDEPRATSGSSPERHKKPDGSVAEYYPVRLVAKWRLGELPGEDEFLKATEED